MEKSAKTSVPDPVFLKGRNLNYTVCTGSSDLFYTVSYCIIWVTTSRTYGTLFFSKVDKNPYFASFFAWKDFCLYCLSVSYSITNMNIIDWNQFDDDLKSAKNMFENARNGSWVPCIRRTSWRRWRCREQIYCF